MSLHEARNDHVCCSTQVTYAPVVLLLKLESMHAWPVTFQQVGAQAAGEAPRSVHRGEQDGGATDGADVAVARGVRQVRQRDCSDACVLRELKAHNVEAVAV